MSGLFFKEPILKEPHTYAVSFLCSAIQGATIELPPPKLTQNDNSRHFESILRDDSNVAPSTIFYVLEYFLKFVPL